MVNWDLSKLVVTEENEDEPEANPWKTVSVRQS